MTDNLFEVSLERYQQDREALETSARRRRVLAARRRRQGDMAFIGKPLGEVCSGEEAELCLGFIRLMSDRDFPGAVLVPRLIADSGQRGLGLANDYEHGLRGYVIGVFAYKRAGFGRRPLGQPRPPKYFPVDVGTDHSQPVALCEDATLHIVDGTDTITASKGRVLYTGRSDYDQDTLSVINSIGRQLPYMPLDHVLFHIVSHASEE
jgi:hypothetical protein